MNKTHESKISLFILSLICAPATNLFSVVPSHHQVASERSSRSSSPASRISAAAGLSSEIPQGTHLQREDLQGDTAAAEAIAAARAWAEAETRAKNARGGPKEEAEVKRLKKARWAVVVQQVGQSHRRRAAIAAERPAEEASQISHSARIKKAKKTVKDMQRKKRQIKHTINQRRIIINKRAVY